MADLKEYKYLGDFTCCAYYGGFIRVRILHRHSFPGSGVDMVLIDQKGTTINAKIQAMNAKRFSNSLEEGRIYDIARFSIVDADRDSRPTRHKKMLWINPTCRPELIPEIKNFPKQRKFNFTPLQAAVKVLERQDCTFLHDLMGVIIAWTEPIRYDVRKLKREVTIQDPTGASVRITLWNEFAEKFGHLDVSDKSVFVIGSASVNVFRGVAQGFSTSRFSSISVDIDHPKTLELKKSDKYEVIKSGVKLADWRDHEKTTLAEIFQHFDPSKVEERYTSVGRIAHDETFLYRACTGCNSKSPDDTVTFNCEKCGVKVSTHIYCRSRVDLSDSTSTESVTLFGSQLESILGMKIGKIIGAYKNNTLSNAFASIKDRMFVFLLKPNIIGSTMYLSVSKIGRFIEPFDEMESDYLRTGDSLENGDAFVDDIEGNIEPVLSPATPLKKKTTGGNNQNHSANTRETNPIGDSFEDEDSFLDDNEGEIETGVTLKNKTLARNPHSKRASGKNQIATTREIHPIGDSYEDGDAYLDDTEGDIEEQSGFTLKNKTLGRNTHSKRAAGKNQIATTRDREPEPLGFEPDMGSNSVGNPTDDVVTQPETPDKPVSKRKNVQTGITTRKNAKISAMASATNRVNADVSSTDNDKAVAEPGFGDSA